MIQAIDLKPGHSFVMDDGSLYTVLDIMHNKTAMRKMICKTKVKNLRTGAITDFSFSGDDKFEDVHLTKRKMQYLYNDGEFLVFMDEETYDQVSIPDERLKWELNFLVEQSVVEITYFNDEILGIELPAKIALLVTHSEPAVKGDTAQKAIKDAELETGFSLKVPLFINEGERIYVRTNDGTYDSRADKF